MSITVKRIIRRALDILCFVIGPTILVISLLDFVQQVAHHPSFADDRFGVGIGVALITFGFLRMYWSRHERNSEHPDSL